jgi:hypothetical protein
LAAGYQSAARELMAAMGTPAEAPATQHLSDAIGALIVWGSPAQLAEVGVHADVGVSVVLPGSREDADQLRDVVARGDRAEVRSLLATQHHVPAGMIDEVLDSIMASNATAVSED